MQPVSRRICVFCGSNVGQRPEYATAAAELGQAIAKQGWGLVYGGGNIGLMGVVADAVLASGGEVIGVIPESLKAREVAHKGLTRLHVTKTMHERKALMADLSDAFAALPGGYGTLDELFEILTWAQLGIHQKPIAFLDLAGFFDPMLAMLDHQVREGFLMPKYRSLIRSANDVASLLDILGSTPSRQHFPDSLDPRTR